MNTNLESSNPNISLREQIQPFIQAWPWLVLSSFICIAVAFTYLRYTTNKYEATASIIIKDTQFGGGISESAMLGDMDLFGSNFNSIENEIEILNSKRLLSKVIDVYNLTVTYSKVGNVKESDVYKRTFINVQQINSDSLLSFKDNIVFYVKYKDEELFEIKKVENSSWETVNYGSLVTIEEQTFLFTPNPISFKDSEEDESKNDELKVVVRPKEKVIQNYHKSLNVINAVKRGSVIKLAITDVVPERAVDVLDQLIIEYNKDATNDKNIVALNTANFIEERLQEISIDLDSVERGIETFKTDRGLTDIMVETSIDLEKANRIEAELLSVETQLSIAKSLNTYMAKDMGNSVTTSGLGLKDVELNMLIQQYNEILITYQRVGETSTAQSPVMTRMASELRSIKNNITNTLSNYVNGLEVERNQLLSNLNQVNSSISSVPSNEKTTRTVERNREVVEAIYLLLREKQETTAISLAVTAPKAKIIDSGYAPDLPVSPKPKIIYLAALIFGLLIPFGLIYLKQLLYDKIESRKDIEKALPQVSILGEVPKLDSDAKDKIQPNDRSILAESFRIIRTNLQYKLSTLPKDETSIILVTSTVKGEGKTTTAFNLASTFAYSGKKVLLIGGDIRNPQLHRFFDKSLKSKKGLTEYLVTPGLRLNELVVPVEENKNLSLLLSGAIPPNPAELLMQDKIEILFEEAKAEYDLVIIDTAPTIVVTDTFLINKYADVTVYVSRANYTDKSLLEYVADSIKAGKLSNVAMVINSVKLTNFGYGNKYGYSYSADKMTFMDQVKSRLGLR